MPRDIAQERERETVRELEGTQEKQRQRKRTRTRTEAWKRNLKVNYEHQLPVQQQQR